MSPTTHKDDGTVTVHEGEAPPADAAKKGAPKAPRARTPRAAPKTGAVKKAEGQRRTRLGKHRK